MNAVYSVFLHFRFMMYFLTVCNNFMTFTLKSLYSHSLVFMFPVIRSMVQFYFVFIGNSCYTNFPSCSSISVCLSCFHLISTSCTHPSLFLYSCCRKSSQNVMATHEWAACLPDCAPHQPAAAAAAVCHTAMQLCNLILYEICYLELYSNVNMICKIYLVDCVL